MAKRKSVASDASTSAARDQWSAVTWQHLADQFDERTVSRGERYQRSGHVRDLGILPTGELIAFVDGTETYATRVSLVPHRKVSPDIVGECSCPVGSQCKHAVAVVLQALSVFQEGSELTVVEDEESDERLLMLSDDAADSDGDSDDDFDDSGGGLDYPPRRRQSRKKAAKSAAAVVQYIDGLPVDELRKLLHEFAEQDPSVYQVLERRVMLSSTETDELVKRALKEVRRVTAEPAWHDHWRGTGSTPDYSLLQQLLERLSGLGLHDELLEIGRELRRRGLQQVGQSDDDGMTGTELATCLKVVFAAIPKSSLPVPEQLLYAIDALLDDDYSICDEAAAILDESHSAADWSVVADQLVSRIDRQAGKDRKTSGSWSSGYRRGVVARFLISALDEAGRSDEALHWSEIEATENSEYRQLCERLRELGRFEDLRSWAQRGIAATQSTLPGIAQDLRELLVEDWRRTKDWGLVAAAVAVDFCDEMSVPAWKDLLQAARRAKCEADVRAAMLWHLNRGRWPELFVANANPAVQTRKPPRNRATRQINSLVADAAPAWPLPALPAEFRGAVEDRRQPAAITEFLIDLAIDERRVDDIIRLYDSLGTSERKPTTWGWNPFSGHRAVEVAEAVAAERPDYALTIRQGLLERSLQPTGDGAYDSVIRHIQAIRPLLQKLQREHEYAVLIDRIRTEYRRRRNLIEKLDRLERPRIVDSKRR